MSKLSLRLLALAGVLSLGACAVVPAGGYYGDPYYGGGYGYGYGVAPAVVVPPPAVVVRPAPVVVGPGVRFWGGGGHGRHDGAPGYGRGGGRWGGYR